MILCQLVLLYFWVKIVNLGCAHRKIPKKLDSREIEEAAINFVESFWYWKSFIMYVKAIVAMSVILAGFTALFHQYLAFGLWLGTMSAAIEALLGIP